MSKVKFSGTPNIGIKATIDFDANERECREYKTIDDFILELMSISEDKRKLPLVIQAPNGITSQPKIKMLKDDYLIFNGVVNKMLITY